MRVLVVGDAGCWTSSSGDASAGSSPEAPVPVVEFERESFMPGGAANVARNLTALGDTRTRSSSARMPGAQLVELLQEQRVDCSGLIRVPAYPRPPSTRIVAHIPAGHAA